MPDYPYIGNYPTTPQNVTFAYSVLGVNKPDINGSSTLCSASTYTAINLPTGVSVSSWQVSPASGVVTYTSNGNSINLTPNSGVSSSFTLTANYTGGVCSGSSFSKTFYAGKPYISGTYTNNGSSYPLAYFDVDDIYNNACTSQMVYTNLQLSGASSLTWSKVGSSQTINWGLNGNNIQFYLWTVNATAIFQASASNGFGTLSHEFAWKDINCGGGGCTSSYIISPNPSNNSVTVIPDIPGPCLISAAEKQILQIRVYDTHGTLKISKQYKPNTMQAQVDVSGLKPNLYMVDIFNGTVHVKKSLIVGK